MRSNKSGYLSSLLLTGSHVDDDDTLLANRQKLIDQIENDGEATSGVSSDMIIPPNDLTDPDIPTIFSPIRDLTRIVLP